MSLIALDIGASSTRHVSANGRVEVLPNNMVFLNAEDRVDMEPYSSDVEGALELIIEKDTPSEHFPARVLIGQMANRYSASNVRPSGMLNKYTQKINYISIIAAVAVNKFKHGIDPDVSVFLALPPMEVSTAKDIMVPQLKGEYTVEFPKLNGAKINFKVDNVYVYAESHMATFAYFFNKDGTMREPAMKYTKGKLLSLDIGASTTDLAVVEDMKYLEKSGQTYKNGGNIARDFLIDALRLEYGFDVPIETAEYAMAEGRIQVGNTYKDCSKEVCQAKKLFAAQIVEQIQNYFRKVNIPIQTIRAIMVSGGGSMAGGYVDDNGTTVVTSKSISEYITEELSSICNGVEVEQFSDNPRMANIIGLYIRASLQMARLEKQRQEELAKTGI